MAGVSLPGVGVSLTSTGVSLKAGVALTPSSGGIAARAVNVITANSFNPASLFTGGIQGGWYDPSDLTTLFQDSAGTTPVTAAGQPVGLVKDKSGNGHDWSQATSGLRPLYQTGGGLFWLAFDGVDDTIATTTAFTLSMPWTNCGGVSYASGSGSSSLFSVLALWASSTNYFGVGFRPDTQRGISQIRGAAATGGAGAVLPASVVGGSNTYPDTNPAVITAQATSLLIDDRVNGSQKGTTVTTWDVQTDANFKFAVSNNNNALTIATNIYGALTIASNLSAANLTSLESYMGVKCGVVA